MFTAEGLARRFHEAYEALAPQFGYRTREASAVPWADVPQQNRNLMIATAARVLADRPLPTPEQVSLDVELIERVLPGQLERALEVGVLIPSEIRLNGQPIKCPRGEPVTIHEIAVNTSKDPHHSQRDEVKVTMTFWARSVRMAFEEMEPEEWNPPAPAAEGAAQESAPA